MQESLFIEDGYTAQKTIPAIPGLLPEVVVRYRPALAPERYRHRAVLNGGDADAIVKSENALFTKYVETVNGATVSAAKLGQLKPFLRNALVELILGYAAADEAADLKNS